MNALSDRPKAVIFVSNALAISQKHSQIFANEGTASQSARILLSRMGVSDYADRLLITSATYRHMFVRRESLMSTTSSMAVLSNTRKAGGSAM